MNSIILRDTVIEDNVIIGAGSVVSGILEKNSVYAGVPARKIMSLEEYKERLESRQIRDMENIARHNFRAELQYDPIIYEEYQFNYVSRNEAVPDQFMKRIGRTGYEEKILDKFNNSTVMIDNLEEFYEKAKYL